MSNNNNNNVCLKQVDRGWSASSTAHCKVVFVCLYYSLTLLSMHCSCQLQTDYLLHRTAASSPSVATMLQCYTHYNTMLIYDWRVNTTVSTPTYS